MALFGVKEIVDPLAKEVREGYQDIRELLAQINECAHELVENRRNAAVLAAAQLDATRETNRLLRGLVELNGTGPGSKKIEIVNRTLGRD